MLGEIDESRPIPHSADAMRNSLLVLMLIWMVNLAGAQEAATKRAMSLTDCVQEALQHNLDLQIERHNPEISLYELRGAYSGWDPVFSFEGTHERSLSGGGFDSGTGIIILPTERDANVFRGSIDGVAPWGLSYSLGGSLSESYGKQNDNIFDQARGGIGIELAQPLLKNFWIDSTRLNIAVSKNRLKYSEQGLRARIIDVITSVEKAYFDLIAARENVKVQEKALQLAQQLLSENKRRVEVGTLAPLDEKQAESQAALRHTDLLSAQQAQASAQNALKSMLTDNYREFHDVEIEPAESLAAPAQILNLQDSWAKGMTQRPELLQAKLDAEQQGLQLKYDYNQLFPQLDLIGSYGRGASGPISEFSEGLGQFRRGDNPSHSYGARITLPLSNAGARNSYRANKLTMKQRLLTLKQLEQTVLTEIDNNVIAARVSYERVNSTREGRRYAEAALEAEQKKLESGKSTSFFVLQLQRDLTAARSEEIRALADYNKALADLARGEGSTLERRAVNVEIK
jgi:outer membrane protein